jgi:hypothetical protein
LFAAAFDKTNEEAEFGRFSVVMDALAAGSDVRSTSAGRVLAMPIAACWRAIRRRSQRLPGSRWKRLCQNCETSNVGMSTGGRKVFSAMRPEPVWASRLGSVVSRSVDAMIRVKPRKWVARNATLRCRPRSAKAVSMACSCWACPPPDGWYTACRADAKSSSDNCLRAASGCCSRTMQTYSSRNSAWQWKGPRKSSK